MGVKRALVSVYDKSGVVEFCKGLQKLGIEILSTGGTQKILKESWIKVVPVEEFTGFPEIMDGRVKTLHPKIHGGILAARENKKHLEQAKKNKLKLIDLVVVNLYPFEKVVSKEDVSLEDAIENIDIGGPAMVRAAAKNYKDVAVVVDPSDYGTILKELKKKGEISQEMRQLLAIKAFKRTADYDSRIDEFLSKRLAGEEVLRMKFVGGKKLRYGENWHQAANVFSAENTPNGCAVNARQLHGKEMSYNNYVDADAALQAVREIQPGCGVVVVKHTNPCGFATGKSLRDALEAAWAGDPVSAFGSVIALTRKMDSESAEFLKGKFVEIVIAPGFEENTLAMLREKKDLRLLETEELGEEPEKNEFKYITGGLLRQEKNLEKISREKMKCVTKKAFPETKYALAAFANSAVKHVKSNAIAIAREYEPGYYQLLGMGAGQPNRVDALRKLAVTKAGENTELLYEKEKPKMPKEEFCKKMLSECVLASDAFFPFPDSIEEAAKAGIKYIIQPGGSVRDQEVVDAADGLGISMIFTGVRMFRH